MFDFNRSLSSHSSLWSGLGNIDRYVLVPTSAGIVGEVANLSAPKAMISLFNAPPPQDMPLQKILLV